MMNQDNPYAMNQTCKVCGEPAAGFHFGAFTCEGCKSFFGRSYNNLSSIADCKNNGECIINKKNRTACKACRLRKCILVGMSKSGSRYGRRSNWFKIHCLLQEQQQQQQAAFAAHHSQQQQQGQPGGQPPTAAQLGMVGQKTQSVAAAAALGMLGHHHHPHAGAAAAYPGLFPPRNKEELMMLGLEEYAAAKHSAAIAAATASVSSPSVSSPESHNSDSSIEVNMRSNPLLQLGGKHVLEAAVAAASAGADSGAGGGSGVGSGGGGATSGGLPPPHQLRKDLPTFLPLHFPSGLTTMPVMPPPAFLPPSHLLFPGYHPALYTHHQSLLKPLPTEQQQAAAAAAMQQLFASSASASASVNAGGLTNRYAAAALSMHSPSGTHRAVTESGAAHSQHVTATTTPPLPLHHNNNNNNSSSNNNNNNSLHNGSKAAEVFSKRFYLDAYLKSQRDSSHSPPTPTGLTKLNTTSLAVAAVGVEVQQPKHDHSISALFTPNSESGGSTLRDQRKSLQSNDDEIHVSLAVSTAMRSTPEPKQQQQPNGDCNSSDCDEDLVVSMTPPRSPAALVVSGAIKAKAATTALTKSGDVDGDGDDPIDLSMKPTGEPETLADRLNETVYCKSNTDDEHEDGDKLQVDDIECGSVAADEEEDGDETSNAETVKSAVHLQAQQQHQLNNSNSNKKNNNNNNNSDSSSCESENLENHKRKARKLVNDAVDVTVDDVDGESRALERHMDRGKHESKRVKLRLETESLNNNIDQKLLRKVSPLDLTTKV